MQFHDLMVSAGCFSELMRRLRYVPAQELHLGNLLVLHEALSNLDDELRTGPTMELLCEEMRVLEATRGIMRRRAQYFCAQLVDKLDLPRLAKSSVLETLFVATPANERPSPNMFTHVQRYADGIGRVWLWAPFTCEAWYVETVEDESRYRALQEWEKRRHKQITR